ncbi:MAG: nucleoside permease [Muribaculaceae bacterium]|nr:nucleoside permease [Muribaculaceae bacterium]
MSTQTSVASGGSHFLLKSRLAAMGFLEFGIWGAYLTSLGAYLAHIGMGAHIGWFYAVQGIVSIFMPGLVGIVADRWMQAQKVLSLCQLLAGAFMLAAGLYGLGTAEPEFGVLFSLYTLSVAFFMPTIGLSNAVAYSALEGAGLDSVKHFPPIRVFGTVGFICAMLLVNFTGFQNTAMQLVCSGILSFCLAAYALTMPKCPVTKSNGNKGLASTLGLDAFSLFKDRRMAGFFLFSMCLGVSLQITNGFANPFIQSFRHLPEYAGTFGVKNANALISLSQMSETLCILLIPFFLKRFGIKTVMLMAMFAWVLRFGFFGIGNPGSGVWLFILSMIVYGVAFDFFNVSGSLYVDQQTSVEMRSSAQGLFMIMTNGIGATLGTLGAQAVVNHYVFSQPEGESQIAGWSTSWLIFAGYSLVVAILFLLLFKDNKKNESKSAIEAAEAAAAGDDAI